MRCSFHPLLVAGVEKLPQGQCVVAANHASYIDAIVIKAVLPWMLLLLCFLMIITYIPQVSLFLPEFIDKLQGYN